MKFSTWGIPMKTQPSMPQKNPPQKPQLLSVWWLLLIALLLWNLFGIWPTQTPVATIPYSTFIHQVKADNVEKVSLMGGEIRGTFVKPVLWPPAKGLNKTTKAQTVPPEAPAKKTAKPLPSATTETSVAKAPPEKTAKPSPSSVPGTPAKPFTPRRYQHFMTVFPEEIGDANLLPLLEAHGVQVSAESPTSPFFSIVFANLLPFLLLVAFFWWMGRRANQHRGSIFGGLRGFTQAQARRYNSEQPGVTFADVAGTASAKEQLQEEVDFLKTPDKYHALGARIPRGVLLVGPPGTGKTLLARAVAGQARVPFFSISGSEFVEMFVGVGAGRVRDLFKQAKETAPAIVFIDELDAVGRRRGAGVGFVNDEREQTLNQLLVEMDGFDERHEVIVLAATNRPDVLDPALLRPGRFDRQVVVGLPDHQDRRDILAIHCRDLVLADNVDLHVLASATMGMSGADLANLCNEAALLAARQGRKQVVMADFEAAIDKVLLGEKRSLLLNAEQRRIIAYHEAGHTLVAWLMPAADPVHKVTIIPHGQALGVTAQLPGEDRYNYSESYLLTRLAVMLGGRTAEEIVIDDVTTGAENDLLQATRLARRMVTHWGMSNLGLAAWQTGEVNPFLGYELTQGREYSDATAAKVDQEVQRLLNERHEVVRQLLIKSRELLDRLAAALLEKEVVEREELIRLLGPRPQPLMKDVA